MAQSTRSSARSLRDITTVDADLHLNIPMTRLAEYIEDPWVRDLVEEYGTPGGGGGYNAGYVAEEENITSTHGTAITTDEIVRVQEDVGVDMSIVQPGTHSTFARKTQKPVVTEELLKAHNTWVAERVIDIDEGIFGCITLPDWNPDLALEELDRYGDHEGFVSAHNWLGSDTLWGEHVNDPILEKLVELDVPLLLHVGGGTAGRPHPSKRTLNETILPRMSDAALSQVFNLIFNGAFDKYPDLDVIIGEAGIHWITAAAWKGDEYYQSYSEDVKITERLRELGQDHLQRMPSEYVFDNFYVTTQPIALPERATETEALLEACRAEEMFLFSTDWPHMTVDTPDWVFDQRAIDEEMAEQICHGNAEDVFRLPVSAT